MSKRAEAESQLARAVVQLAREKIESDDAWATLVKEQDRLYWEYQWGIDGYEHDLDVWENTWAEQQRELNALRADQRSLDALSADLAAADEEIESLSATVDDLQWDLDSEYRARLQAEETVEAQRLQIMGLLQQVDELERLLGP